MIDVCLEEELCLQLCALEYSGRARERWDF
jgi:hypothetical protein